LASFTIPSSPNPIKTILQKDFIRQFFQ